MDMEKGDLSLLCSASWGKICPKECSGLSSRIGLCGLPKRRKASITVVNEGITADIYKKCHGTERKLLGFQGSTDVPLVIESRQQDWVDFILEKVNQCCSMATWIIHEALVCIRHPACLSERNDTTIKVSNNNMPLGER